MTVKEDSKKAGLKLNTQKTKITASGPITSWQGKGRSSERLYFLGSKITVYGDCSHEIKRHLLLGRKATTNLDGIFKSRAITLPTKVHTVKAMVFPVAMQRCESWTIIKTEHQGTDFLRMAVLDKILQSPFDCKEPTYWKRLWCWERLKAKGEGGTEDEMLRQHHQLNGHKFE